MDKLQAALAYLQLRLQEPSTWAGLMLCAGAFGMDFTEQQQVAITTLGLALCGTPDKQHS